MKVYVVKPPACFPPVKFALLAGISHLHLLAEEAGDGTGELLLKLSGVPVLAGKKEDRAKHVALT